MIPFEARVSERFNHAERLIERATRVPAPRRAGSQAKRESARISLASKWSDAHTPPARLLRMRDREPPFLIYHSTLFSYHHVHDAAKKIRSD
jgi:hypothetical protein